MGYSTSTEEAAKALYAISSLIRNNVNGQEAFHSENGSAMLQVMTIFNFKIWAQNWLTSDNFTYFAAHIGQQQY
jgi:hypothetical protein